MSQQINLFNPAFRKQKALFAAPVLAAGLGAVVVVIGVAAALGQYEVRKLEREVADSRALLTKRQAAQVAAATQFAPRQKDPGIDGQVTRTQAEIEALRQADGILRGGGIGNNAGYAPYFRAFAQQAVPGVWLTGLRIVGAGNDIEVRGRALQAGAIPGYIAQLQGKPAFHGKTFAALSIAPPAAAADAAAGPQRFVEFSLQSQGGAAQ